MNTYNSIIVTHQARLRCILHNIITNSKNATLIGKNGKLHRFQNGCIVHVQISKKNTYSVFTLQW